MKTRLKQLLIGHFLNRTHSLGTVLKSSGLWGHGVTKRVCLLLVLRTHKSIGLVNCIPQSVLLCERYYRNTTNCKVAESSFL